MYEKRLRKTTLKAFYAVLQVKKESQNKFGKSSAALRSAEREERDEHRNA